MPTTSFSIHLKGAGKRFFRNWIFRNLSLEIEPSQKISITGINGSGKSTLLQVIAGYESLTEGTLHHLHSTRELPREEVFRHLVIAAPYLDLIEEYTLWEIVNFHFSFKRPVDDLKTIEIIELMQLENSRDKVFRYFSSGMKQRTKLALALLSDVELVLLDEPLSNLDKNGILWYSELTTKYLREKTTVVCSNQNESEYFFCTKNINIEAFK